MRSEIVEIILQVLLVENVPIYYVAGKFSIEVQKSEGVSGLIIYT